MKKILASILFVPGVAFAQQNVYVQDMFRDIVTRTPTQIQVCEDVAVPGKADLGKTIIGGAIGSAVGNQVSKSDGAGAAGAVIGAIIANSDNPSTIERRCRMETRYGQTTTQSVYSHSQITFTYEGKIYTLRFNK